MLELTAAEVVQNQAQPHDILVGLPPEFHNFFTIEVVGE